MQLQIKPYHKNTFPLGGILVRSPRVADWLTAIQELNLAFSDITVYPIPDNTPNSIWGCLIMMPEAIDKRAIGKNEVFQVVTPNLFIAELATLYPAISPAEIQKLLGKDRHMFHPDFGLVALNDELVADQLPEQPALKSYYVSRPAEETFVPQQVRSFRVEAVSPGETLKNLEEKIFPKKQQMKDKPLTISEKAKLLFYSLLFKKTTGTGKKRVVSKTKEWVSIEKFLTLLFKNNGFAERLQQDFEDLDKRNQKEVDKLLDLLANDPEEALKYAIPLDGPGATRGSKNGQLSLIKRWLDLSWSGNSIAGPSSGGVDIGDRYNDLQKQYMATAETLIARKKYHDAAFVYMKLLKNPNRAAEILETGKYYRDAATIYITHTGNKRGAAECYEKGNMTLEAIEIYKELKEDEKVGDLYSSISRKKEADVYYNKVADDYKGRNKLIKASIIYKQKIGSLSDAQEVLLNGWHADKDAANCLTGYFSNISDVDELKKQIDHIYMNDRGTDKSEKFLSALKHVYSKRKELSEPIREMAYEIVAAKVTANPLIVSELKFFNPNDRELTKDTLRYKVKNKS